MSPDFLAKPCDKPRMVDWVGEAEFNEALLARLVDLRGDRTQKEMAAALGVPHERYKKYEKRSPLPAYLLPRLRAREKHGHHKKGTNCP